jgi:hypothetical protein
LFLCSAVFSWHFFWVTGIMKSWCYLLYCTLYNIHVVDNFNRKYISLIDLFVFKLKLRYMKISYFCSRRFVSHIVKETPNLLGIILIFQLFHHNFETSRIHMMVPISVMIEHHFCPTVLRSLSFNIFSGDFDLARTTGWH